MKPYKKEQIETAVKNSNSYSDVFRALGLRINGGSYSWLKRTIKKFDLSTVHFLSHSELVSLNNKNKRAKVSGLNRNRRIEARTLRIFMLSHGKETKCNSCTLAEWQGKSIVLDVDHINEDCHDNHIDNLQFLCPNCHRQKTQS